MDVSGYLLVTVGDCLRLRVPTGVCGCLMVVHTGV